jgi:acetyltransferase-like isoleucine patch superfamily enzyme
MARSYRQAFRVLGVLLAVVMPASRFKNHLLSVVPGWSIAASAHVGHSVLQVVELSLGEGSSVGSLCFVRGLRRLELHDNALLGNLNLVSAAAAFDLGHGQRGTLILGAESAITNRHYLDCSGGIQVGRLATIAGCRSTVLSHQIDLASNRPTTASVMIGDRCFVGSNAAIVSGSQLPDDSVLAMGALLRPGLTQKGRLYGGVPARDLGPAKNEGYRTRSAGPVAARPEA